MTDTLEARVSALEAKVEQLQALVAKLSSWVCGAPAAQSREK